MTCKVKYCSTSLKIIASDKKGFEIGTKSGISLSSLQPHSPMLTLKDETKRMKENRLLSFH